MLSTNIPVSRGEGGGATSTACIAHQSNDFNNTEQSCHNCATSRGTLLLPRIYNSPGVCSYEVPSDQTGADAYADLSLHVTHSQIVGIHMGHNAIRVCKQHRRRPACASAQSDQRLCYSLFGKYHM